MIPWDAPRRGDADYIATVRIQNGRIRRLMRERGIKNQAELARRCKLQATTIGEVLNFRKKPLNKDGRWRDAVLKIADALSVLPDELFSPEHLTLEVPTNKRDYLLTHEDVMQLAHDTPEEPEGPELVQAEQLARTVASSLECLPPREREILERRFGLAGREEQTLEAVAEVFGLSRDRIRQLEARALRKLRHKDRRGPLLLAAGLPEDLEPPRVVVDFPKPPEPLEPRPDAQFSPTVVAALIAFRAANPGRMFPEGWAIPADRRAVLERQVAELSPRPDVAPPRVHYIGSEQFADLEHALQYQRALKLNWPAEDLARLARMLKQLSRSST